MAKRVLGDFIVFDAAAQMEGLDRSTVRPDSDPNLRAIGTFTAATNDIHTMTEHGFGQAGAYGGPVQVSTSGSLPTGLSASTNYWYRVIDRDTFYLYTTELAAASAGTQVDITGTGSGTHTMNKANTYQFPLDIIELKIDTGDGGDVLITISSDAQDRYIKLDSTPANDTLWVPVQARVKSIYIQTLPANGSVEARLGHDNKN